MENIYTIIIYALSYMFIGTIIYYLIAIKINKKYEVIRKTIENYTGEKIIDFFESSSNLYNRTYYTYITENGNRKKVNKEKINDIILKIKNKK